MTASTIRISQITYLLSILLHQKRFQRTHLSNRAFYSDRVRHISIPADHITFTSGTKPKQMHFVIQIFLLLPIFILTTTTTNATFDSDTNDVIFRRPTSSYSTPLPYPLTTPCDTVPEMNRKSYFELATTTLADTYKYAWDLRKRGKLSEGNSKEIKEKDGDSSNDDDIMNYPDHYLYDVCFYARFSKDFSKNSERDCILRRYWAIIDEYCNSISVSLASCLIFNLPDRLPVSPFTSDPFICNTNVALS